jgi:hypothetical protein
VCIIAQQAQTVKSLLAVGLFLISSVEAYSESHKKELR